MNKNKILIGCSVTLAISLMLAAGVGYYVYRRISNFLHVETPAELQQPRVLVGQELFEKSPFLNNPKRLGGITSIVYGKLHPGHDPELCVAGNMGALFLDEQGNQIDSVTFEKETRTFLGVKAEVPSQRMGPVDVVDVDGDLFYEFLVRQSISQGAELLDHDGKIIWGYKNKSGESNLIEDMAAGDVDGDGQAEYVVTYFKGKGLMLLDHSLKEIWSKPEVDANTVEMVDTDGSGKMKILHDDATRIFLRDASGNIISEGETGHDISAFTLARWPSKKDRQYVLQVSDDAIHLIDFNGKTVKDFNAPLSQSLYHVHAVPVKLSPDEPEYFAAVAEFSLFNRSVLYVYNSTGNMVYQEVLSADYKSIAALPIEKTGQESILLGGYNEVLQYKMNIAPKGTPVH